MQFQALASGTPDPHKVEFLNQGDRFSVTLHDTPSGLRAVVKDTTNGTSGSMTASAANGFGQVKFAPSPSTQCTNIPYNFHPMYATSTAQTTVPWAAATYNVAFDTEIGHFDYCSAVDATTGTCTGNEGVGDNTEVWDYDDAGCWPGSASGLIQIGGCEGSNVGYDGTSYLADWPNGSSSRPTAFIFTSPLTGKNYDTNYSSVGFNTDLPAIEGDLGACDTATGAGCTIIPPTDEGKPALFYPFYSTGTALGGCAWTVGQMYPGFSTNSFGAHQQYGQLLKVAYSRPEALPRTHTTTSRRTCPTTPALADVTAERSRLRAAPLQRGELCSRRCDGVQPLLPTLETPDGVARPLSGPGTDIASIASGSRPELE
ncbi:MAG: hypothetical protein ACYDCS_05545 [Candidatus Dormibacteria bacterium]